MDFEDATRLVRFVTGLLPTILLSLLMFCCQSLLECLHVFLEKFLLLVLKMDSKCLFCLLMVNGFLVTALASSATATITEIIDKPTSAMSILANKLPLSSNFISHTWFFKDFPSLVGHYSK